MIPPPRLRRPKSISEAVALLQISAKSPIRCRAATV